MPAQADRRADSPSALHVLDRFHIIRNMNEKGLDCLAADVFTSMKGITGLNPAAADVVDARRILRDAVS
jgi:hypothetical protein